MQEADLTAPLEPVEIIQTQEEVAIIIALLQEPELIILHIPEVPLDQIPIFTPEALLQEVLVR